MAHNAAGDWGDGENDESLNTFFAQHRRAAARSRAVLGNRPLFADSEFLDSLVPPDPRQNSDEDEEGAVSEVNSETPLASDEEAAQPSERDDESHDVSHDESKEEEAERASDADGKRGDTADTTEAQARASLPLPSAEEAQEGHSRTPNIVDETADKSDGEGSSWETESEVRLCA